VVKLQRLSFLDSSTVSPEEKVKAINAYGAPGCDMGFRRGNFITHCGAEGGFVNYLPPYEDSEDEIPNDEDLRLADDASSMSNVVHSYLQDMYRSAIEMQETGGQPTEGA
jgi:hypothetical protein